MPARREWTLKTALRFIFHPADNPFFALMWRQQRRLMGQWVWHLGLALGCLWLAFAIAIVVMVRLNVPIFRWGAVLFEVAAWSHLCVATIYAHHFWRRLQGFWREDIRPQLLLTGVPPLWLVAAALPFPLFMQVYLAILCLPFYAAAITLGGGSWGAALLAIAVIVALSSVLRVTWWLAPQLLSRAIASGFFFWSNLPTLIARPIQVYAWTMPVWLFLTLLISLVVGFALTTSAWMWEPRKYPSQRKAILWGILFIALSALLLWGLVWAYLLPAEFEGKLAFTLVLTRWLVSGSLYGALTTPLPFNAREAGWLAFGLDTTLLGMSGLLGWASGVPFGGLSKAIVVGAFINVAHAIATAWAWDWWRKVMASKEMPATWWLLFSVWLAAPLAFLHPALLPLGSIQGWLVPLALLPPTLWQRFAKPFPFALSIPTTWTLTVGNFALSLPLWLAMAMGQLGWSALLRLAASKGQVTEATETVTRQELTATHPLWGWLVRLEERWCEKWGNPLVTLQLRWQRRFPTLISTMNSLLALFLLFVVAVALMPLYPEPAFIALLNGIIERLPSLAGVLGFFAAGVVLSALNTRMALWRLGQKRIIEQFVLAPLTERQWVFGFWFPRFWLALKAALPCFLAIWWGVLLRPELGKLLLALLVTATLPVGILALSLAGLVGSLLKFWESYLLGFIAILVACIGFGVALLAFIITPRNEVHVGIWLAGAIICGLTLAVEFRLLQRLKKLRTPKGYDEWLLLSEIRARLSAR
jgi:hypothetical protein